MSQAFSNADGVPLFACTKCNSRHPFEDLSQGHQLCKECKGSFQVVKCNYCRTEFQRESANRSNSICKKCELLQEQHGKPGPCSYCNIIAAFIGTKCQRCNNSEKKYGPPMSCEHCRQKCAFDRKDPESKKKVDGKLLCWLCTMAYKRTLAKARQKEAILKSSSSGHRSSGVDSKSYSSSNQAHQSSSNGSQRHSSSSSNQASASNSSYSKQNHRHAQLSSSNPNYRESSSSSSSSNKKLRLDLSSSTNGLTSNMSSMSSLSDTRFIDPNHSDLAAVVAQLKDQVALLNKRLQMKEKDLLSKDQQIADLKSTSAREQRELREKINVLHKQHTERISEMQAKMVAMQKQIASQTKSASKQAAVSAAFVEPPLVI